ncbi:aliphatic sulfonate ABC transporter substrate-binding protein [Roseomonas gilardii subsp. gilardii]|uniref:aliphatic sulfonate ABC transporter substrate-binding protein n=1 Tax=Roseomonas gilardii TaxID=257708 RepID=UPI001FF84B4A|nr:aliphatic sulfonate ABC transporter substrate-binding protein [Roseomonas gilardii]UPG73424.1 aliphatic sulfonate ABC transporter substrate-binding protein [Roseomonas gilardii subsp. gilardii]
MTSRLSRRRFGLLAGPALASTLAAPTLLTPSPARAATPVRIGYQKNGSLVILRQQRRLEALNIPAQWIEFPSGPPMLEALNAGAVDFGATGDTPPIFAQAAGADLLYAGGQPVSGRNSAILVRKDSAIRSLGDLKGRRLAFTKGSSAHNFVVRALASVSLGPGDIQAVQLQPSDAAAAFRQGSIDAWAIWDPFFAIAQQEPETRVLTTAENLAPSNSFFLASRAFADRDADTLLTLLGAVNEAADWAARNPDDLARIMAEVTGVPLAVQRVAAARGVYAVQAMDDTIIAQQQAIADSFAALRIIPRRIEIRVAVWTPPRQIAGARP